MQMSKYKSICYKYKSTCSMATIKTLEQGVKSVQSLIIKTSELLL